MYVIFYFGNLRYWENVQVPFFKFPQKIYFEKSHILEQLPNSESIQTATLIFFLHRWEDGSRKVSMNDERRQIQPNSLKLLTCYEPSHSKTLFFDLNPKGQNLAGLTFSIQYANTNRLTQATTMSFRLDQSSCDEFPPTSLDILIQTKRLKTS